MNHTLGRFFSGLWRQSLLVLRVSLLLVILICQGLIPTATAVGCDSTCLETCNAKCPIPDVGGECLRACLNKCC